MCTLATHEVNIFETNKLLMAVKQCFANLFELTFLIKFREQNEKAI